MNSIAFQDLRESDKRYLPEIEEAVVGVLRTGRYLNGEQTAAFEQELGELLEAGEAVACSNGLDALRLILESYIALGRLQRGDEVIVPANTFVATLLSVSHSGLTPVVAEPSESDFNLDLSRLPIGKKTRGIIPVHLYGTPCWDREKMEEARRRGLIVIEDNAQAIGARAREEGFNGTDKTGSLGDASAISFYPAKNIGAAGDAGAVATSDPELARMVRKLRNYGSEKKYEHEYLGHNCRMDEIQAAVLRVKLRHLDEETEARRRRARQYDREITNPLIRKPEIRDDALQVWHQYVVRTPERDRLRAYLKEAGIGTEIHYPIPVHKQKCYAGGGGNLKLGAGPACPVAEKLAREILSLPIANATESEIEYITSVINRFS